MSSTSINRTIIGKDSVSGAYASGKHMQLEDTFSPLLQRHEALLRELSCLPTLTNTAEIEAQLVFLSPRDAVNLALPGCETFRIQSRCRAAETDCKPYDKSLIQRGQSGPSRLRGLQDRQRRHGRQSGPGHQLRRGHRGQKGCGSYSQQPALDEGADGAATQGQARAERNGPSWNIPYTIDHNVYTNQPNFCQAVGSIQSAAATITRSKNTILSTIQASCKPNTSTVA
ncbi:hypothetical protein AK830_g3802 [Neonectria ditissima]|uniref:Uncharacterized protein n=1 Tax=Neonectria ditissima TaxID=78410 RepID=A0A0P7BHC4_9HYPO|nr:hypothetical protein AK830_g3802 [Neonectria ditissima]